MSLDDLPRRFATPLQAAQSQVGVIEDPPGSNRGIPWERYSLPGEDPLAWCARFVRWCFTQSARTLPGQKYLIGNVERMHHELALQNARVTTPLPGDIIFYLDRGKSDVHKGGRHVGIVEVIAGDGRLTTIEGNWSNKVARRIDVDPHGPDVWDFMRWLP